MAETDMDPNGEMSLTFEGFVQERELLLMPKGDQTARGLATELVKLMVLLAIHGDTGIRADPDAHLAYIDTLTARIDSLIMLPAPTEAVEP